MTTPPALILSNRDGLAFRFRQMAEKALRANKDADASELVMNLIPDLVLAVPPAAFDPIQPVDDGILIFHGGMNEDDVAEFQHDLLRTHMNLAVGKPITLHLSSFGGSVYAGFALASTIWKLQREGRVVNIHVQGAAMSMASALTQVGNRRTMESLATFMLHKISYGIQGSTDEHAAQLKVSDMLHEKLFSLYSARTGKPVSYYMTRLKKTDWYMDAEEALHEGLVDEITGPPVFPYAKPVSAKRGGRKRDS